MKTGEAVKIKVGLGYDHHRLVQGRALVIGGIKIPFGLGALAHSDGDVLVHALIDALLGAKGEGDIGQRFPDSDPAYKDISSLELLRGVMNEIKESGLSVVNADAVIVLERPKLASFISGMKTNLCPILGIKPDQLGIKAKTGEGGGQTGQNLTIACWAVVLLGRFS